MITPDQPKTVDRILWLARLCELKTKIEKADNSGAGMAAKRQAAQELIGHTRALRTFAESGCQPRVQMACEERAMDMERWLRAHSLWTGVE